MGRFYKTANPQFLDYMYELPKEAMMKAIQTADSQIGKQEQANDSLRGLLKLDAIDKDKPQANQILEQYEGQINNLSAEIQENPLEFRRKSSKIANLQRSIHEDFTRGNAATIQGNYNTRASNYEAMKDAIKKNPELYNYQDIEKLQSQLDGNYEGFEKGAYNTDRLREFVDIKDFDKFGKDYEADIIEKLGAFKGQDGYLYTSKNKREVVDANTIKSNLVDILMSDKKLNDYYGQQVQLGNMTEEGYMNLLAETADRIGEKYGYNKTSKGTTSIKGDPKAAAIAGAREQYYLNNPIANVTPGTIYDVPVLSKYQKADGNGQIVDNNSLAGIDEAMGTIRKETSKAQFGISKLAQDNNIIISDDMASSINRGDFSVLKGAVGQDGKTIDSNLIFEYQSQYDNLKFDEKLLASKKEVASTMEDPDTFLQEQKNKPAIINNVNDFQTFGLVSEDQAKIFNKHVNEWRKEIDESKGYWDAGLQFDVNDINKLPPALQGKIQNGMSIMDLINNRTVKIKTKTKDTGKPLMQQVGDNSYPTGETIKEQINTTDFENFKVNGKFAKPATQLDGQGNVLVQFEVQIDGTPINVYMDESKLSNKTVKGYMDLDAMKAGHQFMEAKSEGVITEDGFMIEGINFRKANGKDVADTPFGTVPVNEAVKMIAAKRRKDREQLLQQ